MKPTSPTSEKPSRIPPPLFHFAALFFGFALDRVFRWQLPAHNSLNITASVLAAAGCLLALWAVLVFKRHNTTFIPYKKASTLITQGPFRFSRNPIYLSFIFLHLACALSQRSPGMLITLPFASYAIQTQVIRYEEQLLSTLFGNEWLAYCVRVRRWL